MLGHSIYRNWCDVCVKAWGQEGHHRKTDGCDENGVPILDIDYGYMSYKDGEVVDGKVQKVGIGRPMLVIKCLSLIHI